jgi:hypothetical protein
MTTTAKQSREYQAAQRALRNFAQSIARQSNWEGTLARQYAGSYGALLRAEDALGIEACGALSDRLTALRHRAGLSPEEIITAERDALAANPETT